MGTIIARDIPDEGTARILAGSAKAFDTLKAFRDVQIEGIGDGSEVDWEGRFPPLVLNSFKQIDDRVLQDSLAALGVDEYDKRFLPSQVWRGDKDNYRAWQVLAKVDPERAQAKLVEPSPQERLASLTERHTELTAQAERIQAEIADTRAKWLEKAQADLVAAEADLVALQPQQELQPSAASQQPNTRRKRGKANGKADP